MRKQNPIWLILFFVGGTLLGQDLGETYISKWKEFYPSMAVKSGIRASIFNYEDRSAENILEWVAFNENILRKIQNSNADINAIDARLLKVQAQSEVDNWKMLSEHTSSLHMYTNLISTAIPSVIKADFLLKFEKSELLCTRFKHIVKLVIAGKANLKEVSKNDWEKGMEDLSKSLDYLQNDLETIMNSERISKTCADLGANLSVAIQHLQELQNFGISILQPRSMESEKILGQSEYDRRLQLYTDSELTSKKLGEMALREIETVKVLMADVSKSYISETYPDKKLPLNTLDLINLALADMEKDAPLNSEYYLEFWQQLSDAAVQFIEAKDIATLPKDQTLHIQTAPENAGAAARIGWVASAPPFDPNPLTVLNLPSIPNTLPKQEQIDFWASFNKPFNRMIVIHELFPGHYMQMKISRETPHPIRLLFPYGVYIEGWATFTEKVLLDADWEVDNYLTLLAHLRKRLENANRAYTSVQVHCNGWDQNEVLKFSTETSLLAPQFAKSLWGRIMNSPMQLTSYFLGGAQFTDLLKFEKDRLKNNFNLKLFMDTIMKAGPIPIDEYYNIFEKMIPN